MTGFAIVLACSLAVAPATAAQTFAPAPDKSQYSIINPTPREFWRPLSADRPDTTESPYTVDAGAVQVEMSFIDYAKSGNTDIYAIAPTNLKIGLLNFVDLQLVFAPFTHIDDGDEDIDGFSDTQLRLKVNLWGNDSGSTAFAFMPFISFPTASDDLGSDHVEGGLIFPFSVDLAEGIGLGLMFETDFVYDEADDGYDTEFVGTAVLGFDLTEQLGIFIEGVGVMSTDSDAEFLGTVNIGGTYSITDNLMLDAGIGVGLTDDADDLNLFAGMTVRF
jgi:Putative MetA-pathway of phenol degradation